MECGIGRTTLGTFVRNQTKPHARIRRLLAQYYLGAIRRAEAEEVDERRAAIARLFPDLAVMDVIAALAKRPTGAKGFHLPAGWPTSGSTRCDLLAGGRRRAKVCTLAGRCSPWLEAPLYGKLVFFNPAASP
jgi:hypothetical protein